jgi:DNA-binding IclR family transcriptional regulator
MAQDNTVQSVERAIKILEELATEKEGLGVTELLIELIYTKARFIACLIPF